MNARLARYLVCGLVVLGCTRIALCDEKPKVVEHATVFGVEGKFGGWPANHGMWNWGNEILVGFSVGEYKDLGNRHHMDREKPEHHVLARSLDGGHTWKLEYPAEKNILVGPTRKGFRHGTLPPGQWEPEPVDCPGGVDFTHPDFAMTLRMEDANTGESRFYYTYDRGKSWKGPFKVPMFGQKGISARTDMVVNGKHDAFFFLTASKSNNEEGRIICVRTTDGCKTFELVSYVGPEPKGYYIMPSTVRISPTELLCTIRCKSGADEKKRSWIEAWRSKDNCKTWEFEKELADCGEGNPPALLKLKDGRLCVTYGVRSAPFEMQALFSSDNGHTWSTPFVIEGNGGGRDIGYPRNVLLPDGNVVTAYYFYSKANPYRQIHATIWNPGEVAKK